MAAAANTWPMSGFPGTDPTTGVAPSTDPNSVGPYAIPGFNPNLPVTSGTPLPNVGWNVGNPYNPTAYSVPADQGAPGVQAPADTGGTLFEKAIPIVLALAAGAATGGFGTELAGALGAAGGAAGAAGAGADAGAVASDAGAGVGVGADAGVGAGAGATAALPADAGVAGGVADAGAVAGGAAIPELTVTAPFTGGASSLGDVLGSIAPIAASGLAGITGAPSAGLPPAQAADFSGASASNTAPGVSTDTPNFLSASDTQPSLQPLDPGLWDQFGIDPGSIDTTSLGDTSGAFDPSTVESPPSDIGGGPSAPSSPSSGGGIGKWLSNPKNLATLGSLGISGLSGMHQPALPASSKTAAANASAVAAGALPTIQSGGTATPMWSSQKASIDATIDNQIKQQTQSLMQAAANSGEGNQNSGIVQQQIASMTQQANLQRQQLYTQAQQQNVQNAIQELSGSDALLAQIGNMQLAQEERAQQIAAQTASLALRLYSSWGGP